MTADRRGAVISRWNNGGVDGTTSSYMALCLSQHVDKDVDVVLVRPAVQAFTTQQRSVMRAGDSEEGCERVEARVRVMAKGCL